MKKKMIAMAMAFLLVVTNASMASALSPVAEVYFNAGTSVYDSSEFDIQLNEAIKEKLTAGGVNPKYVSIMDASADPAAVTDSHVHSGYNTWYNSTTPAVVTADYNHVQISNNGKTLTFYGYTVSGYKDFMLTSGAPEGKKMITFDMDESKADYHSMDGGGFLFNTEIDSEGDLSGYAILYVNGAVEVYNIDGVNAEALHNESYSDLGSMAGVSTIGTYTKAVEAPTQHTIKINVTDTTLNMWDNGIHVIKSLALPDTYGNEFGPIVSHIGHGCEIISIFSFDNMKLFSTSDKTLNQAAEEIVWEENAPLRYVVNINDDPSDSLDGGTNQSNLKNAIEHSHAQYIGVTDSVYEELNQNFINEIANGGLFVSSDSENASDDIIERIAERVANQIITQYKDAILAIEDAEDNTAISFNSGDHKNAVSTNITLEQSEDVTTVWSSNEPSIIAPDGTVTRPITNQSGVYVDLKATITKDGLTSEKIFTVYVLAAAPAPLSTLSAVAGNGQVTLNFPTLTGASDGDIVVEQSTDGSTFTPVDPEETLTAASTSATITGLTNGVTYYYRLVVDSGFFTGTSNEVEVAPSEPITTLSAVAGNKNVTLKFPAITGASNIVVEQSTDGVTFTPVTTKEELNASSTKATVVDLTNGETYYFRLVVESGQHAGVSNVVTVEPVTPYSPEQPTMNTEVIVSDSSSGGAIVKDKITKLVGTDLKVSGTIKLANGQELNVPQLVMNEDGTFTLPKLGPGEYQISMNVIAPNGEKLAGPVGKLVVDANGKASVTAELVDPYGTILDTVTNQPVAGVDMQLYWADTELNRSKGRVPGTLVELPELPDFAPNQNHNPQISSESGEYGWMVYADGDYYFLGKRDGYVVFDSREDTRDEQFGSDSYIKDGVIHVGQTIVKFSFSSQPIVKAAGTHDPYMVGYPDGSFAPERGVVRAEIAAILSRLYTSTANDKNVSYSDVSASFWAADAIETVTNNKWMIGSGDNTFQPNKEITRAEFAQLLMNVYKWNVVNQSTYTDVTGHWAEKAIATVEKQGLKIGSTDEVFNPNQKMTRLEVVQIFNQLLGRNPWHVEVDAKWTDVPESHEYYLDIMEASVEHPFEQYETGIESWKNVK
ncbi:S-layer homology domain-containing protein [Paenibacillus sp. strain BS8-2]